MSRWQAKHANSVYASGVRLEAALSTRELHLQLVCVHLNHILQEKS